MNRHAFPVACPSPERYSPCGLLRAAAVRLHGRPELQAARDVRPRAVRFVEGRPRRVDRRCALVGRPSRTRAPDAHPRSNRQQTSTFASPRPASRRRAPGRASRSRPVTRDRPLPSRYARGDPSTGRTRRKGRATRPTKLERPVEPLVARSHLVGAGAARTKQPSPLPGDEEGRTRSPRHAPSGTSHRAYFLLRELRLELPIARRR